MMIYLRLKDIREDNDLKQGDLADFFNMTRQNYSRWETGQNAIPLKHLFAFCEKFDVSMDYLIGRNKRKNYPNSSNVVDKVKIGKRLREIRKRFHITQVELANMLNTTHSTISAYEHGKTLILTNFACQIALNLDISMDYLCGRID